MLYSLVPLVALLPVGALAQNTPLASKRFNYTNLPYQADTSDGERGRQSGYNICNSTTTGPESMCQTAIINALDDFCLWAPQEPNSIVGDVEGSMVAWCTKDTHGTRQIPAGALQGVQFMRTPHYVQVTGYINQSLINIQTDDYGGEMDPHGADQRGNPLGGLLFSTAFSGNTTTNGTAGSTRYQQVIQWHNFMGANRFCLKACDPSWEFGYRMCEHIYDRIGCQFNAPSNSSIGEFETCLGDDQLPPGIYVGENGVTSTYTQPPESLGIITSIPYVAATPASSSCTAYNSTDIYVVAAVETSATTSAVSSTASASNLPTSVTTSRATTASAQSSAPPASSAPSNASNTSGAGKTASSLVAGVLAIAGVVFFV